MFAEAAALAAACAGKDGWDDPAPPARIFANTHYVGTCGISAILVTSTKGHILIDGGTRKGADLIAANVQALGFRLEDVKWIVSSHEHVDHVGGLAELKRRTGARVAALAAAAPILARGTNGPDDPQHGGLPGFEPVRTDRIMRHGERLTLGPLSLTAVATPAHSPGGSSWSWRACKGRTCRTIIYGDSLTPVSATGYRFRDHADRVSAFRSGSARLGGLRCDILLTPHPSASALFDRLGGKSALTDEGACRAYADRAVARLNARLAEEAQVSGDR